VIDYLEFVLISYDIPYERSESGLDIWSLIIGIYCGIVFFGGDQVSIGRTDGTFERTFSLV
jgi:hypothetical protein